MVKTSKRTEAVDITLKIQSIVSLQKTKCSACLVFCQHTTASVMLNESFDKDVVKDLLSRLSQLVPENGDYSHSEGNSDAHIKTALCGSSVLIPIHNGKLALGKWQGCMFLEFDGPRERTVMVQFI